MNSSLDASGGGAEDGCGAGGAAGGCSANATAHKTELKANQYRAAFNRIS
jgi:hypothetical protein